MTRTLATDVLLAGALRPVPLLARDCAVTGVFGVGALERDRAGLLRPLRFELLGLPVANVDGLYSGIRLLDGDGTRAYVLACGV